MTRAGPAWSRWPPGVARCTSRRWGTLAAGGAPVARDSLFRNGKMPQAHEDIRAAAYAALG
jgi:hypothetical protein